MRLMRPLSSSVALCLSLAACGSDSDAAPDASADAAVEGGGADAHVVAPIACVNGTWNQHLGDPEASVGATTTSFAHARVRLHRSTLDTHRATDANALAAQLRQGAVLATLHLRKPLDRAMRASLARSGIVHLESLRDGFHIVRLAQHVNVQALSHRTDIESIQRLDPADKLLWGLAPQTTNRPSLAEVFVVDAQGVIRSERRTISMRDAAELAERDDVLRVVRVHIEEPLLDTQRPATHADEVQGFSIVDGLPHYAGLTGRGIVVAVHDTGVDSTHPDFHAYSATGEDLGTRVTGTTGTPDPGWSHGTIVAGMVGGNGWASDGMMSRGTPGTPYLWRGLAPEVDRIVATRLNVDVSPWITGFVLGGALLSNNSHTQSGGEYGMGVYQWDLVVSAGAGIRGNQQPPRPVVFAAGNNGAGQTHGNLQGYYSINAPGKNPITVGATQCNDGIIAPAASKGPTLDGRIKPDVVAPSYKDYRPLDGLNISIDEVRIHARDGSGASDIVWTLDDDGTASGFSRLGVFSSGTLSEGILTARTNGSADDGVQWTAPEGIDATQYDYATLRVRTTGEFTPPSTRRPVQWVTRWSRNEDASLSNSYNIDYATLEQDAEWHTLTAMLEGREDWNGTIRKFQWSPTAYINGGATGPTVGGGYGASGGTSMAAPVVTGIVALMMQRLHDVHAVDWVNAPLFPSTLKALVIQTAEDLIRDGDAPWREQVNPDINAGIRYFAGPDFASGYGLINAASAIALIDAHDDASARRWTEQSIANGEIHSWSFEVTDEASPLKATLAWDDLPASYMLGDTERTLVNDLDIVLLDPAGRAHSPWLLDPLPIDQNTYASGRDPISVEDQVPARQCDGVVYWIDGLTDYCEDRLNNVEQVYVATPMAGTWRMLVRGHDVLAEATQRYSLVMSQSCASQ